MTEYTFDEIVVDMKQIYHKIEESIVNEFAKITGDYNSLHMDEEYAAKTKFGKRICHGMLLSSFFLDW